MFNLSILPGTAFRQEAEQLGLTYQPWPPYYVLKTPTLNVEQMYRLMEEAQEAFGIEFDPLPPPRLDVCRSGILPLQDLRTGGILPLQPLPGRLVDLDGLNAKDLAASGVQFERPSLCFALWLRSADFHGRRRQAAQLIDRLLTDNPHTTLLVILEPAGEPERLTAETLDMLLATCYRTTNYLDRYYSLHPGRLLGSKRLFILLPLEMRDKVGDSCAPSRRPITPRCFGVAISRRPGRWRSSNCWFLPGPSSGSTIAEWECWPRPAAELPVRSTTWRTSPACRRGGRRPPRHRRR